MEVAGNSFANIWSQPLRCLCKRGGAKWIDLGSAQRRSNFGFVLGSGFAVKNEFSITVQLYLQRCGSSDF